MQESTTKKLTLASIVLGVTALAFGIKHVLSDNKEEDDDETREYFI